MLNQATRQTRDPSGGKDYTVESMRAQWKMQYAKVEELCELIVHNGDNNRIVELAKELLV